MAAFEFIAKHPMNLGGKQPNHERRKVYNEHPYNGCSAF